ncbi:MAG: peptide ABC transporter substrate-binding protein, partial [Chloroflexaceae bacterium]|nr:peptide ABC transporter substrate-binding protein [Chloroflexaceae bacterium]
MQTQNSAQSFGLSLLLACVLLGALVLVGCAPGDPNAAAPTQALAPSAVPTITAPPTLTPRPPGGNLTVRLPEDVPALRPWQPRNRSEEQVIKLLYSGLMRLDSELRPQPDLATDWATTPDGRVLTFTLRDDVRWHDGQPFDADDVRFTIEQLRSLPFTTTALLADLRLIAAVSVPNSSTVALSLTERYAPLLAELTLPILPEHALQDADFASFNFWDVPIGTGPFLFDNRVSGQSIVLARNPDFYRGAPLLE